MAQAEKKLLEGSEVGRAGCSEARVVDCSEARVADYSEAALADCSEPEGLGLREGRSPPLRGSVVGVGLPQ